MYIGWADGLIQPGNAIEYYDGVVTAADGNASKFSRLYLAPGMGHCSNGSGPNAFGGTRYLNAGYPNPVLDPQHDPISAIVAWVSEEGPPLLNGQEKTNGIEPFAPYNGPAYGNRPCRTRLRGRGIYGDFRSPVIGHAKVNV
jgi:hypothetical protein